MFVREGAVPRIQPTWQSILFGALLLGGMLWSLSGCDTDIESGIESANDLLYKKQYVAAERLYHKLFKRLEDRGSLDEEEDEQRLLILDRLGKVNSLYLHDYPQAITYYEKLVLHYPKTDQALAARATVADIHHHKLGNLEAAISEYQKLVAEFPDKPETRWAQLQISGAFFALKDYEQARTEAETLINRWPGSPEAAQARFQIANSYYVQGRYAEAIATYERLLEGEPDPQLASLVLFELGNCFQEVEDPQRALAYYYACLSDHPNPMLVQRKIRRVRARLHRVRPAEEVNLPEYVQKRLAVVQSPDGQAKLEKRVRAQDDSPETNVFPGSSFDATEGQVRADGEPKPKPKPKPVPEGSAPAPEPKKPEAAPAPAPDAPPPTP